MSEDIIERLRQHLKRRELCAIARGLIDASRFQCFVVSLSDVLAVLYEIRDFIPSGYSVVRVQDITEVSRRQTDVFQQTLLEKEGEPQRSAIRLKPACQSYKALMSWLEPGELMIIENETAAEPDLFLGRVESLTDSHFEGRYLSGAGIWNDDTWRFAWWEITCMQFRTPYLQRYQRFVDGERCLFS